MGALVKQYKKLVSQGDIVADSHQLTIVMNLQTVYDELVGLERVWRRFFSKNRCVKGLYFWGGVGIGKTFLMDLFFNTLPIKKKIRLHFHRFMQRVQSMLRELQGQQDPLETVAERFRLEARVLCFDEFFVKDIADAMILERLFTALFKRGVCLVATSNIDVNDLYMNGLHRRRFLPAIALIKKHCTILRVESDRDYRLRVLKKAGVYFFPVSKVNIERLRQCFNDYSSGPIIKQQAIEVESRMIDTVLEANNIVWFEFSALCQPPRSQLDYLAIADSYDAVVLSGVPVIDAADLVSITYLIHLVDVFYDERVKLIILAEAPPAELYQRGEKAFEFRRTVSRLEEMQTEAYLTCK